MLRRRPILGLIVILNLCVLLWRISVQEPPEVYETQAALRSGGGVITIDTNLKPQHFVLDGSAYHQRQQLSARDVVSNLVNDKQQLSTDGSSTQQQQNRAEELNNLSSSQVASGSSSITSLNTRKATATLGVSPTNLVNTMAAAATLAERSAAATTSTTTAANAARFSFPDSDFRQLIDLHNFSYIITQPACNGSVEALILIHSAPHNQHKRMFIRETWGGSILQGTPMRAIFLLGAVRSPQTQQQVEQENAMHGDLVQGSFMDAYKNMTYKHAMALKWFTYNCAHAQLLFKVDDDIILNTPMLLRYWHARQHNITMHSTGVAREVREGDMVDEEKPEPALELDAAAELFDHPHDLLFCRREEKGIVKRTFRSKWRVSFREYPSKRYPPNCPGFSIFYSADVVFRLYETVQKTPYFWIDDVHVTGFISQRAHINITTSEHYALKIRAVTHAFANNFDISRVEFLFTLDDMEWSDKLKLWSLMIDYNSDLGLSFPPITPALRNLTNYIEQNLSTSYPFDDR